MMELKFTLNNISVSIKTDGETVDEGVDLAQTVLSWGFEQPVELYIISEEDDNIIYCEGVEPSEEREIEGL